MRPVVAPVMVGACRPASSGAALEFARQVNVPFRLILSQRLLSPPGRAPSVADLLAGEVITLPRLRRDAFLFDVTGYPSYLADCAERVGLIDVGAPGLSYCFPSAWPVAQLRAVTGRKPALGAAFFSDERSYDLVLDLVPLGGSSFAWHGFCLYSSDDGVYDNVPLWVSRSDGSMSLLDFVAICDAGRGVAK